MRCALFSNALSWEHFFTLSQQIKRWREDSQADIFQAGISNCKLTPQIAQTVVPINQPTKEMQQQKARRADVLGSKARQLDTGHHFWFPLDLASHVATDPALADMLCRFCCFTEWPRGVSGVNERTES